MKEVNKMNNIVMDNMMRQCVYNSAEVTGTCPIWLWVVLGVVVLGFVGFLVWVIKETWIW
jgi:hypothetical protein